MDSQIRNLFADLHEIPGPVGPENAEKKSGEGLQDELPEGVSQSEPEENVSKTHETQQNALSTEEIFANDDKYDGAEAPPLTPNGCTEGNAEVDTSSGEAKRNRKTSAEKNTKMEVPVQDVRRSSRHDKEMQRICLVKNKINDKTTELDQINILPSLRRSNRANKGVSKEMFDPSYIPLPKNKGLAGNHQQTTRDFSDGRGKGFLDSEIIKKTKEKPPIAKRVDKKKEDEACEEPEDSESESDDDDGYNDPNRLWCICKKPHNGRFMISCDLCEEWYHGDCVGVTVQRGKQMEKRGEEYVCPSCLKNKAKKGKPAPESDNQALKSKSGVNLKGYAHDQAGRQSSEPQTQHSSGRKRIREGIEKTHRKSSDSLTDVTAKRRKCIVSTCNNEAQSDSVYCSNVCILRHAKESLGEMTKVRKDEKRKPSMEGQKETKEQRISRKIKEASAKGKVAVYCRKTGKIYSNASAPLREDLNSFLKQNPTFKPLMKLRQENSHRHKSSHDHHSKKKTEDQRQVSLYAHDPDYKPEQPKPSNPYKPQTVPVSMGDSHKSKKHKIERQESNEAKKSKQKKLTDHDRRYSNEKYHSQKITPSRREGRSLSDDKSEGKKEVTPQKEKEVRKSVQKSLQGILQNRSNNSEDLKMHPDSITRLANKIEDSLYKLYGSVSFKYKNRYRSIMFNLKDEKNEGLWRKVILGEVTSSSLVKMTAEEMASKELAQWRKHELTQELEMIHELEVAKQNIRPVAKITHKGEIAINEDFSDLTESHLDAAHEKVGPSVAPQRIRRISATQPDSTLDPTAVPNDTTAEHNDHLFDMNCRICTGQVKEEDANLDEASHKAVKRSTSIILSNEAQTTVEKEQSDEEILKKISAFNRKQEKLITVPQTEKDPQEEQEVKEPISPEDDFITKMDQKVPKKSGSVEEEAAKEVIKKDPSSLITTKLSREHFLWTGVISMPELSSFRTNAYTVSGNTRGLINTIPAKLVLDGRIHPEVVWDYLAKVSTFPNKEVCVIQFRASSEDDRVGYVSMLSYFSSRRRFGVVSNQNTQVIKDVYLVPLLETEDVPYQLMPMKGPGIPKQHPSMLLGVIVRCITEPQPRKSSSDVETLPKHEEKTRKHKSEQEQEGKKSLLDRNRLLTPAMPHFTQKIKVSPKKVDDDEEEYNPETANFGDLIDDDIPEKPRSSAPTDDDDEAYDPEKLVFDDGDEEDDAPYDPELEAERLENTELKALQEKQAFLEKMKQELEFKKAELAKEEMSLQQVTPPPKVSTQPLTDPRIAARMRNKSKTVPSVNTSASTEPETPLQKIFSVLNFDRSKNP